MPADRDIDWAWAEQLALQQQQQYLNATRSMQQDVREIPPSPPPKRLIDMKGAEAVKYMLADARRRLVGKG